MHSLRLYPLLLAGIVTVCIWLSACGDDQQNAEVHEVSFVGNLFDVTTGSLLSAEAYSLEILVGAEKDKSSLRTATIDATGRFSIGPIGAFDDYTVRIRAEGYRPFESHNAAVGLPESIDNNPEALSRSTQRTLHFDAYLFRSGFVGPELTFNLKLADKPQAPAELSGVLRLVPTGPSSLAENTVAGVEQQIWDNDADLQNSTISQSFASTAVVVPAGQVLDGVTYQRDIFGVEGYAPYTDSFALANGTFAITLLPEATSPLEFIEFIPSEGSGAVNGALDIVFNQPVTLANPTSALANLVAYVDFNSISCPTGSISTTQRGLSIQVDGTTVRLRWDPAAACSTGALPTYSAFSSIDWQLFSTIQVAPAINSTQLSSLSALTGVSSRTVPLLF